MITKQDLGAGYLLGTGFILSIGLAGYFSSTQESLPIAFVGTLTAGALVLTFLYTGFSLSRMEVPDEFLWSMAQWSGVGLGIATIFSVIFLIVSDFYSAELILPSLIVNQIAAGASIGLLLGAVNNLKDVTKRERELNHRNTALNRVLRHNIKNDMNVILGHLAQLKGSNTTPDPGNSIETIQRKGQEILEIAAVARRIDDLGDEEKRDPIPLRALIEDYMQNVKEIYSDAQINADLPDNKKVKVDPLTRSVLQNLVDNAIEHTDCTPQVEVDVHIQGNGDPWIHISVADNGPGIPDDQIEALSKNKETPLEHGEGLGLCLVKWFVDEKNGELIFEDNDPRGSIVTVRFPAIASAS